MSARRGHRAAGLLLVAALATSAARAGAAAEPATVLVPLPRAQAVVDDAQVRLSDLFEGAGEAAERVVVGPAPAPGRRTIVEAPQLLSIARAHGLSWRPMSAHERVVVERPGRALSRDEVAEPIRAALLALGADPEAELDLPGLAPPMVPPGAWASVSVEGVPSFDVATGRFGATLAVSAEGAPTIRLRVAGRAVTTVPVVVAARRLALGEVVGPGERDARPSRLRADRARPGLASDPAQVVGQQMRRPVAEGQPIALADLAAAVAVEKGATVTMLMESAGLALTTQGRALESAARGATVSVMNLSSRQVVEAVVVGPGRVRVSPGAGPVGTVPPMQTRAVMFGAAGGAGTR